MSSFYCPKCQKLIQDTPRGYITGCEHFPIKSKTPEIPDVIKQLFNL